MTDGVRGRIPGRTGLWEITCRDDAIEEMTCVNPGFAADRCLWVTPGLFDLQINGISGINFTSAGLSVDELGRADGLIRDHGISRYCPTLITSHRETTLDALGTFDAAWRGGALIAAWGVHLEGPWISPEDGYRGIHQLASVRDPDPRELDVFQRHSGDGSVFSLWRPSVPARRRSSARHAGTGSRCPSGIPAPSLPTSGTRCGRGHG
jgi:N-acetylglucosamine-6-phosphate deacetylase